MTAVFMRVILMTSIPVRLAAADKVNQNKSCENGRIFNKDTRKVSFKWRHPWIVLSFEIKSE